MRKIVTILTAVVLCAGLLATWSTGPATAAVIGYSKDASEVTVGPGDTFDWQFQLTCSSVNEACEDVVWVDTLPTDFVYTGLTTGSFTITMRGDTGDVFTTLPVPYAYAYDETTGELAVDLGTVAGGSSFNVVISATLPSDTTLQTGDTITNEAATSCLSLTNPSIGEPAEVCDGASIDIDIPIAPDLTASKNWTDGSALAQSGEASTVELGIQNLSTSSTDVTELILIDQTNGDPATDPWDYFTLTDLGTVTMPAGADQVQVLYCLEPYATACTDAPDTWTAGAQQAGPDVVLDGIAGVPADVTGVQFVFSNSAGGELPFDSTGGTVDFELTLRDTERDGGAVIQPTSTLVLDNLVTPSLNGLLPDGSQGITEGRPVTDDFQIVPNIASVDVDKDWFATDGGGYTPADPPVAFPQINPAVAMTIDVTNESPFPVETVTITEPSATANNDGGDPDSDPDFEYMNIDEIRLRFPTAADTADVTVTCADGSSFTFAETAPPDTVAVPRAGNFDCPDKITSVEVTYSGSGGGAVIDSDATAGLDIAGTLDGNAVPQFSPLVNCADGEAINTGNGSTSAVGTGCDADGLIIVLPGGGGNGSKTISQQTLPPDTQVDYTLTFTNDSAAPLPTVIIVDPASSPPDGNPFDVLQINEIEADCGGLDFVVELNLNDGSALIDYESATQTQINATRQWRLEVLEDMPVDGGCEIVVEVERRPGVDDDIRIFNCFFVTSGGAPVNDSLFASTFCTPLLSHITGAADSSANLQKFIEPATVPQPTPGLDDPIATVKLRVSNTGNTHFREIVLEDRDDDGAGSDFFGAFEFVRFAGVSFPPGADRVQLDVCTTDCATPTWITGTTTDSATPPLPAGVDAADVRGVRVTFTSSDPDNDFFNLVPGENFPDDGPCPQASACFEVTPRTVTQPGGDEVLGQYENTASASAESRLTLGGSFPIPPVDAEVGVITGRPAIDVDKQVAAGSPANIAPGSTALFDLEIVNDGTAPLPDLIVSDPIPAELIFDETGVNGSPFEIVTFDVPDGTTAPGPMQFVAETDADGRVDRLVWTFPGNFEVGSRLVIRVGMTLAGGVSAGSAVENTMGAGSQTTDDFDCSDAPPNGNDGVVIGAPYPAGQNCTDPAQITTSAGTSFESRKWVAGNASLGFYDTASGTYVDIDDPVCPTLERGGETFTRQPCVALVYPGERYDYLAVVYNAGTFPARNVRLIDVLPVLGDTGVLDPDDRGTEWSERPTIVAAPTLVGGGDLSLSYAPSSTPCVDDLSPPSTCAPDDWVPDFTTGAASFQAVVEYPNGLAPDDRMTLVWQMDTPVDLDPPGDPAIAWNSFAHSELVDVAGVDRQLLASEPPKVGVGMLFGTLRVVKDVVAEPGATVPTDPFPLVFRCEVTPEGGTPQVVREGTGTFAVGDPFELTGVPAGAICSVEETDDQGGTSSNGPGSPATVVIGIGQVTDIVGEITITNTFVAPPTTTTTTTVPSTAPAPTPPPSTAPPATLPPPIDPGLPETGGSIAPLLFALLALGMGGATLMVSRRQTTPADADDD